MTRRESDPDTYTTTLDAAAKAERWRAESTNDYPDDRPTPEEY